MSHIFLYGPVGAGKSTVGRVLANHLKLPFVDSDHVLEMNAGRSISEIMQKEGETACRDLETAALKQIIANQESVIALGGGALLREENRALVEENGRVVFLMADFDTLLGRLSSDSNQRPLLAGNLREKLTSLLGKRKEHYNSFPLCFDANQAPEELAWQIRVALGRFHLSAMGVYDVVVQNGGIIQVGDWLRSCGLGNPIVVSDENVAQLHADSLRAGLEAAGFAPQMITIPSGEAYKTLDSIQKLWDGFLSHGLDRKSTVIALGGGVIGDLTGFAAATYMRGINWVCVPTTLLSMVDASLGGKTGFDLPKGKNLIGSFHSPRLVLADPDLLKTLPPAEFIAGLAEVVKHGIIADPELFMMCTRGLDSIKNDIDHIVKRAMAVKIKIIEDDPYEKGFRAALNLGHTVGHAVELVSGFRLRHGEAIAIGMVTEARLAERLGLAASALSDRISAALTALELPVSIPSGLPREQIIQSMRVDKKKNMKAIRFALPVDIGRVELVEITDLESVLDS